MMRLVDGDREVSWRGQVTVRAPSGTGRTEVDMPGRLDNMGAVAQNM
jgi:hypothetical protein